MKLFLGLVALTLIALAPTAHSAEMIKPPADVKMKFNFDGGEITTMVATYSKATGQKFILDPGVRGKATVLVPNEISAEEAFNHLCDVLAINGFSLFEQGDTFIVKSARNAQRDGIPTLTTLPRLALIAW